MVKSLTGSFVGPSAGRLALVPFALVVLAGCVSVRSYPDLEVARPAYSQLKLPLMPGRVVVTGEFRTLGKTNPNGTPHFLERVTKVLYASGLFESVSTGEKSEGADVLAIVMDNWSYHSPSFGEAASAGFRAGLKGDLSPQKEASTATDRYLLVAEYTPFRGVSVKREYRHAIYHLLRDKIPSPPDARIGTPNEAFEHVVEDLILTLLIDLQSEGQLSR